MDEKIPGTKIYINDIYYLEYSRKYTYLYLHNRTIKTPYSLSYWRANYVMRHLHSAINLY